MKRIRLLFAELARRKVLQTVGAFVVLVWLLAQGFADLFPYFGLPDWLLKAFVYGGVACIPVVAFLSWRYDLTMRGVIRDKPDDSSQRRRTDDMTMQNVEPTDIAVRGVLLLKWETSRGELRRRQCFGPTLIGRDKSCDVQLPDPRVSRRHAELTAINGQWGVRDLQSANGTWLDEQRIVEPKSLPQSGTLRFDRKGPAVVFSIEADDATLVSTQDSSMLGDRNNPDPR